jgi:hypothetical protein
MKSVKICLIFALLSLSSFAQKVIALKEVTVYPTGYVKEVLEKVNSALITNYETKKYFKYNLNSKTEAGKNHVLEQLKTITPIKTNPLFFIYFKFKNNIRSTIIDSTFYKLEEPDKTTFHKFFTKHLIWSLGLEKQDFLKLDEKYEYEIKRIGKIIIINFKSKFYCSTLSVDANNFNLIALNYYNDESFNGYSKHYFNGNKNDIKTTSKYSAYINCAMKFKSLKNNKFVIESLKFDIEYQDYTITNLKNPEVKPVVYNKILSKLSMSLN